jgi:AraC-like DNA-binding protein
MLFTGNTDEYLRIEEITAENCYFLKESIESALTFVWFRDNGSEINVDGKNYAFSENQIICLTEFHKVKIIRISSARMIRFNRPFYCILDNDDEVGCKGVLFFGASQLPILELEKEDVIKFGNLWKVFIDELGSNDDMQLAMLQMLLKRLLILSTRIYKDQHELSVFNNGQQSLIRDFNFQVEQHFRTKHSVAEYADLLNYSPKTISNLFGKLGTKTPLQYIQDRIMLEARRLLTFTDKSIKEVGYEIGFEDIQTFSRFFKKKEGVSPKEFKENSKLGKIANS